MIRLPAEAHPRGDEQFCEDGIPLAIATAPGWVLGPVRQSAPQTDIAKREVALDIDELHVMRTCRTLTCPVALDNLGCTPPLPMPKREIISKRRRRDQTLFERPPVQLVERRNRPVPAGCRNPEPRVRQTPRMMESNDIVLIGAPNRLATTSFFQEPHPDQDVMGVSAQTVPGAYAHGRACPKEPVQLMKIASVPVQEKRHTIHHADLIGGLGQRNGKIGRNAFNRSGRVQSRSVGEIELHHLSPKSDCIPKTSPRLPTRSNRNAASPVPTALLMESGPGLAHLLIPRLRIACTMHGIKTFP